MPPIIVAIADLPGSTVEINSRQPLVVNPAPAAVDAWTATEIDPAGVVEFIPGRDDGSAQFNPGFSAVSQGEAEVVLHNATDAGQADIRFRIVVTDVG